MMQNHYEQSDSPDVQSPTSHQRAVGLLHNGSMPGIDVWNSCPGLSSLTLEQQRLHQRAEVIEVHFVLVSLKP